MSRSGTDRSVPDVRDIFSNSKSRDKANRSAKNKRSVQNIIEDSNQNHLKKSNNHSKETEDRRQVTKTLTERDLKHLERRLSMKKTIRKQISRNLAQAFIDDPNIATEEAINNKTNQMDKKQSRDDIRNTRCLTINQSKVSKCEPTVLDMLKDCENRNRKYGNENDCGGVASEVGDVYPTSSRDVNKKPFWKFLSIWSRK